MQIFIRLLLIISFLYSTAAHALNKDYFHAFADLLYWKASESIDWAYENDLNVPNQQITYESPEFPYKPGFRVGVGYSNDWDIGVYYTQYSTKATDAACGNLKSGFSGGTVGLPPGVHFYDSGQFKMRIDFKMIDLYLGKRFEISPTLMIRPTIGIEGGWIDQKIEAAFQGVYDNVEKIDNNFWGVGPKFGVDGSLAFLKKSNYTLSLLAEFSTAYLFGKWEINDVFYSSEPETINTHLSNRDLGALSIQARVGVAVTSKDYTLSLSYEIQDWFDQLQIFDDATGGHENDLILQGITLRLAYR